MSPDEAHSIVVEGRAFTKEHFTTGRPDTFVGHVEADTFGQAVDVLAEDWGKLLAELEHCRDICAAARVNHDGFHRCGVCPS